MLVMFVLLPGEFHLGAEKLQIPYHAGKSEVRNCKIRFMDCRCSHLWCSHQAYVVSNVQLALFIN